MDKLPKSLDAFEMHTTWFVHRRHNEIAKYNDAWIVIQTLSLNSICIERNNHK